ncbi:MAG: alcohol dehydrogenase catalytic domain-containing protein [Ilumatobacter sp.]
MRAMYYEQFRERPVIAVVPDPSPSPTSVVVRVEASGICRSDWHGWRGTDPDIVLPHVPGHELAGEVVAVGADVQRLQIGDRVTVPFVGGCGDCGVCDAGDHQVCPEQFQPGFTHWGSFAELVAIEHADTNVVLLPDAIASVTAAALGCRVATSFRAVVDRARIKPGEWLAVHGCGGVGLSAVMIGRALGAHVIAVDIAQAALVAAADAGCAATVDANGLTAEEIGRAVAAATGGGAHASIDAIGGADSSFASVMGLRRRGRHVQVGLMAGQAARAPLPYDRVIAWELDVLGSHGMSATRYPAMLDMVADGRIDLAALVTRTVDLETAIDVLVDPAAAGPGITVIDRFG